MALLDRIGRSASLYMGITMPRPEQERFFGVLILTASVVLVVGTLALFFYLTHVVLH